MPRNLWVDLLAIVAATAVFSGYLWVTLTSPIAFGDEGFYSSMGRWIAENKWYPAYYPLWGTDYIKTAATRVPMGFVFSSAFYMLGGEAGLKLMMPFFILLSALCIYACFRKLGDKKLGLLTAFVFITLPASVKYGVLNYPENQMIFFCTLSSLFFLLGEKFGKARYYLVSGMFAGFGACSDPAGFFLFPVFLLYLFFRNFENWKKVLAVFLFAFLIFLPFVLRNLVLYSSPCLLFFQGENCGTVNSVELPEIEHAPKFSRPEVSTGAGLFKFGIIQYLRFGFGASALLAIFGLVFALERVGKRVEMFFLSYLLVTVGASIYLNLPNPRVEELLRYSLFALPAIAFFASYFLKELLEKIELPSSSEFYVWLIVVTSVALFSLCTFFLKFSVAYVILGVVAASIAIFAAVEKRIKEGVFLVILTLLLCSVAYYGALEVVNMQKVKQFSHPFIEACEWVRENLPENATIAMIYAHPGEYNCYRRISAIQSLPYGNLIRLWANDTSYEYLKKLGIEYVFVEGFTVVPDRAFHPESWPLKFIFYLESSENFEKIYDSGNKYGIYGVKIYRVK